MKKFVCSMFATALVAAASLVSVAQAQTFPPIVPWSAAPGAAGFQSGTAGVGPVVNPVTDLPPHATGPSDSWWAGGYFTIGGQKVGYIYHLLLNNTPQGQALIQSASVTNSTTGAYYASSQVYPVQPGMISSTGLNIVTPTGTIEGTFDDLHVTGTMTGANYDLHLRNAGKALFNGGTGRFPMLGADMLQYSIPLLATQGSMTIGNLTFPVIANSWFDRQWSNTPPTVPLKWLWLGINLANGDALSVWNFQDVTLNKPRVFVTILHKDGSETVAAAVTTPDPLCKWQSAASGNSYPLKWNISIPQLNTSLTVVSSPQNQELVNVALGGAYEGLSNVTGIYKGLPAAGVARLEMFGAWQ